MIGKKLSEVGISDILALITNSVSEGKTIDFKGMYCLDSPRQKWEFLADISSFANTSGWNLIFGIKEDEGIAKEITPFEIDDIDAEKQKIESIVRDGISPRINIDPQFIEVESNKFILVIWISKSWNSPNRVVFTWDSKTKDQFFARNSSGRYQLDVLELRNAFMLSETLTDKIQNFKMKRIGNIIAEDTPIPLFKWGKTVLHIIPLESFSPNFSIDISEIHQNPTELLPFWLNGFEHRLNLEGLLTFSSVPDKTNRSYVQLYRTGIIEAVDARSLSDERSQKGWKKLIPHTLYESQLLELLKKNLSLLQKLQVNPPLFIFLSLIGVKDFEMPIANADPFDRSYPIDRDILSLPEHLLQSYDERPEDILRPMFDLIWNACWRESTTNFDENNNWIGR